MSSDIEQTQPPRQEQMRMDSENNPDPKADASDDDGSTDSCCCITVRTYLHARVFDFGYAYTDSVMDFWHAWQCVAVVHVEFSLSFSVCVSLQPKALNEGRDMHVLICKAKIRQIISRKINIIERN